jgi:hypothetical protein
VVRFIGGGIWTGVSGDNHHYVIYLDGFTQKRMFCQKKPQKITKTATTNVKKTKNQYL